MCMYMLQQKNFKWSNVQEMRMLKQNIKSIERGMNSQKKIKDSQTINSNDHVQASVCVCERERERASLIENEIC